MYRMRIFLDGQVRAHALQEPALTIGSDPENDIVLATATCPPIALRFTQTDSGYSVAVVNAKVKPILNGKRMDQFVFQPGDLLEVGSARLLLEAVDSIPAQTATTPSTGMERGISVGLSRLCAMVAEERDLKTLLAKIMQLLLETMGGNEALLFTLDESGKPAIAVSTRKAGVEPLFSDTIVQEVLRTGKGIFLGNALSHPDYAQSQSVIALKLHSVLCCPITAGGKISGLIYLGSNQPSVSFGFKDLGELEIYALVSGCLINHIDYIALQNRMLAALRSETSPEGMVASCPAMKKILDEARMVAAANISVLIQGETGTGKDVLAQFIHQQSPRSQKPFIAINCSTLRGELLASELFGHKKGAFTGAISDQHGLFKAADGGTLFLDEIGDMEPGLQAMLLRTLETGRIRSVGHSTETQVDVRILCATNRDLLDCVSKGTFRQDLYYRINQHALLPPPLRERGEDIILLAQLFLEKSKALFPQKALQAFHPETLFAMTRYTWPGNIRELANAVRKGALFASTPLVHVDFPKNLEHWANMEEATSRFQRDYLQKALAICSGDKEKAAELLGMGRSTFFRHLSQTKIAGDSSAQ